ncbi:MULTISPECIES: NUDIX hydrolase N-terminal domain-containing protein [Acidithrix]|uniref:Putative mutator protein MutT4 n=2 Tax=root TaxID=1 RepID=A0A0D8HJ64_9ACTN|nr:MULTISPECIES: NUDIX hydrolase N-terminal domain-containing protein [Acidithrix]KJF17995.1 putative mutator protein MutT4 [Acidithrix ferrooxidans]
MDISRTTLLRWAEALGGSARTGLGFTKSLYEIERFEEILKIASEIRSCAQISGLGIDPESSGDEIFDHWLQSVGDGIPGYVTPKSAIATIVGNEKGEILLIQRSDSGIWLYPTGWADVGYSPSEVATKEVKEETGIDIEVVRVLAIIDGMRRGYTAVPLYSTMFYCRSIGGELKAHPLECRDVGWFSRNNLPSPMVRPESWIPMAFRAIDGIIDETHFDTVRTPFWREE